MEEFEKLKESGKALILHHWDTDGICSAAMITGFMKGSSVKTMVPRIGMYSLSDEEFVNIENGAFDGVIVADLALPENEFDRLVGLSSDIWVFDHHAKKKRSDLHQFNPVARGSPSDNYPSTTWVLSELWRTPLDLLTVLGAIGDKERSIRENSVYPSVEKYLQSARLTLEELLRMTELIDSNYRIGDVSAIEEAVSFVLEHQDDPQSLLTNETWIENAEKVKKRIAIQEINANLPATGVLVHHFSSSYDIISAVSRKLSRKKDVRTSLVIQTGFFEEYDRVYVRTSDVHLDLKPILDMAQGKGRVSGGKREVVGAIVPIDESESFQDDILKLLEAT